MGRPKDPCESSFARPGTGLNSLNEACVYVFLKKGGKWKAKTTSIILTWRNMMKLKSQGIHATLKLHLSEK